MKFSLKKPTTLQIWDNETLEIADNINGKISESAVLGIE